MVFLLEEVVVLLEGKVDVVTAEGFRAKLKTPPTNAPMTAWRLRPVWSQDERVTGVNLSKGLSAVPFGYE